MPNGFFVCLYFYPHLYFADVFLYIEKIMVPYGTKEHLTPNTEVKSIFVHCMKLLKKRLALQRIQPLS